MTQYRTGEVWLDDFDRGVITTMGAKPNELVIGKQGPQSVGSIYVIKDIKDVCPPPDYEGVPVYFAFPDETIDYKILPSIIVRRDAVNPAMNRWHPGILDYVVPSSGSHSVTVNNPITGDVVAQGYDRYEVKDQAIPYDLLYTIECRARFRNNLRAESLKLLRFMMKRYQPYTTIYIKDSLDQHRSYNAFAETPTAVDIMPDVAGKEANFNITLRVEAELDLNDPRNMQALTGYPTVTQNFLG